MPTTQVYRDPSIPTRPPTQALLFAPDELVSCGLTDAHERPLVGVRTDDGVGVRCWRTSPFHAWEFPLVEWGRTGNSYPALVLDCDSRESVELAAACQVDAGPLPRPSVVATRKASGHCHVAWMLRCPVHRGASAREAPLRLFGRVSEFYRSALRADAGFVGVLAANPVHPDYITSWLRDAPLELCDLAVVVPRGWRMPRSTALGTDAGRNCFLFRSLCASGLRYTDADLPIVLDRLNAELSYPLVGGELAGILKSVMRYRAGWRAKGHKPAWIAKQRRLGERGGVARRGATFGRDAQLAALHATGATQAALAAQFGLSQSSVSRAIHRLGPDNMREPIQVVPQERPSAPPPSPEAAYQRIMTLLDEHRPDVAALAALDSYVAAPSMRTAGEAERELRRCPGWWAGVTA